MGAPKALFDWIRARLGRGLTKAEVAAINAAAADTRIVPDAPSEAERPGNPSAVGKAGFDLITRFEGCARLREDGMIEAYPDPGSGGEPWTIGWGSTGAGIGPGTVWTKAQCDTRFANDLAEYAAEVARAIGDAPTSQAQFDALVSFHYNTGAIGRATLAAKHRAGDHFGAAAEFARWKFAGGRAMNGLVRRRGEEAALYRSGSS